jgi:asparagine synthase (glutamine-hydrolysing)
MCGIVGWVAFDQDLTAARAVVDAMTTTMVCRGPDAGGTWSDSHVALGHRRLAVIDLAGGAQPMTVRAGGRHVTIAYSGEIYNFAELRRELDGLGHRFRTRSDTEVVLHGYLQWGGRVAEKLNGMYAFAVWDGRDDRLALIRDRMGVKPLYYYRTTDGVVFGSEPKALLAHPQVSAAVDVDGLREMLTLVKTPGEAIWDGMRELEPGTELSVGRDGVRQRTYWQLERKPHPDDLPATIANIRELLADIVERQLVSDVPLCVLLSGGLDSSVVTALAAERLRLTGETVRTFALDFPDQRSRFVANELRPEVDAPYGWEVARRCGTAHSDIVQHPEHLADPEIRRAAVTARDLPTGPGELDFSLYLLFRAIKRESTVALSGEAADEVFGGYRYFQRPDLWQERTFPWLAMSAAQQRPAGPAMLRPELDDALDLAGYTSDRYVDATREVTRLPGEDERDHRLHLAGHLYLTRFVRLLLDRKDRISMAVGLEVRVPYCDHRLVEYLYNIPWSMKFFDGREKSLLRAAGEDLLPPSVAQRRKSQYPLTTHPGYLLRLQEQARQLAEREHPVLEIVDPVWLKWLVNLPLDALERMRNELERLLNLATWLELHSPRITV